MAKKRRLAIEFLRARETTDIPECRCPHCGALIHAASSLDHQHLPSPGLPVVCGYCGEINVFAEDLTVRLPTAREMAEIMDSSEWPEMQRLQRKFRQTPVLCDFDFRKRRVQ